MKSGVLTSGVMYECVTHGVEYVLAGSIRDDGPLPDTEMDLIAAQERYAEVLSSNVQLVLSGGPTPATVPDVIGFAVADAEKVFDAAGVKVGRIDTVRAGPEAGVVIATRPAAGSGRPRGASVDLVVSGGAQSGGGL